MPRAHGERSVLSSQELEGGEEFAAESEQNALMESGALYLNSRDCRRVVVASVSVKFQV